MSIRKPFKIPGSDSYYIEIDRKRRSPKTSDLKEANRMYQSLKLKYNQGKLQQLAGEPSDKTVYDFIAEYLTWAKKFSRKIRTIQRFKP